MPVLSAEERIGTQIAGRYTITAVLGEGGMGTVFEAEHTWTGRSVALKLLKPELAKNPDLVTRFLSEARAAAKLKHPNVVDILDMGQGEEEGVFLAMEKLEGEPLSARAKRSALPVEEAVALLVPVMDALSVAHEKFSIVHRDLKPDNIFLATDGRGGIVPKLLDFGIAKVTDDLFAANTHTGTLIGTPWYMSPEQALADKGLGPPSDVWSIAVVFYELVARKRPFPARNITAALAMIGFKEPIPLREAAPGLSSAVCECIDAALLRDPALRPSMRALKERLLAAVGMEDPTATTTGSVQIPTPEQRAESVARGAGPAPLHEASTVAITDPDTPLASTSHAAIPVPQSASGSRTRRWALLGVGALVLLFGAFGVWRMQVFGTSGESREEAGASSAAASEPPSTNVESEPSSNTGEEESPTLAEAEQDTETRPPTLEADDSNESEEGADEESIHAEQITEPTAEPTAEPGANGSEHAAAVVPESDAESSASSETEQARPASRRPRRRRRHHREAAEERSAPPTPPRRTAPSSSGDALDLPI